MTIFDFSSFPTLETERLILRRMTEADAPAILALYGDPDVMRFLILDPPCTSLERAGEIIRWMESWFEGKNAIRWGITLRGDDTVIGTCGFHFWQPENRRADLGYDLNTAHWGKGIITEAARAVIGWTFENLDLHRFQADFTVGNTGSQRVLEKLGFRHEGTWRESVFEHGKFVDIAQYGLLRREHLQETP